MGELAEFYRVFFPELGKSSPRVVGRNRQEWGKGRIKFHALKRAESKAF